MSKNPNNPAPLSLQELSIERLDAGLRILDAAGTDLSAFWDENIASFRRTVIFAIRETSDALLSPTISTRWRAQFENELEALIRYLELADRYIERRTVRFGRQLVPRQDSKTRTH